MQDKDHVGGKFFPSFATFVQFFAWEGKTVHRNPARKRKEKPQSAKTPSGLFAILLVL
jgi:hypothetical protein